MVRSGELFCVVTPRSRTSSGSRGSACETRFCTCTCALSRSVPSSKVTVRSRRAVGGRRGGHVEHVLDAVDLLLERRGHGLGDDLRDWRPDTGRCTTTVGGTTSGYSLIGSWEIAMRAGDGDEDREHRREDRPVDEEVREFHRCCSAAVLRNRRRACQQGVRRSGGRSPMATRCGVTCTPGRTRCRPFTTMVSPAVSPLCTTRRPSMTGPELHRAVLDLVVGADHQHVAHALIGADGAVVDQHRLVLAAAEELHAGEQARREAAVLVLEHCAGADRAGLPD